MTKASRKNDSLIKSCFYKSIYHTALFFARFSLRKYQYRHSPRVHLKEPTLIVCNHTTESDMIMVASGFYEHMFIVCGEHLFRSKMGKIIQTLFNPIPAAKGANHITMVKELTKRLRAGYNVMLFPEGSRSFNGITEPIPVSMGKLIKMSKCAVATYHITGGYFIAPRWAYHFRKGPVSGELKSLLSSEEVASMSAEQLTDLINKDLYEDAYATQRIKPRHYTCDALAEGIENYLVVCPVCKEFDRFKSDKNSFECDSCGLTCTIDVEGIIRPDGDSFHHADDIDPDCVPSTIPEWTVCMEKIFDSKICDIPVGEYIFTEPDVRLYSIDAKKHQTSDICSGTLLVSKDAMEIEGKAFRFEDISEAAMLYYGKSLLFTHKDGYFGLTGEHFHAWKEARLYRQYMKETAPNKSMNAL